MNHTEAMLAQASSMGMEVSDEQYAFAQEVRPQLIKVRTETHLAIPRRRGASRRSAIKTAQKTEASAKVDVSTRRGTGAATC